MLLEKLRNFGQLKVLKEPLLVLAPTGGKTAAEALT
jgi:hypothetical protein